MGVGLIVDEVECNAGKGEVSNGSLVSNSVVRVRVVSDSLLNGSNPCGEPCEEFSFKGLLFLLVFFELHLEVLGEVIFNGINK